MIIWTLKQLLSLKKAIAGRRHPSQLAWGLAFGILLGLIPHGNLLTILLVILVVSLKLNHAMAGLTAVATTFAATRLDPISHRLGTMILEQPEISLRLSQAWNLPLMPWTDLNNTVVVGSLTIGLVALIPVFLVSYPFFRLFRPADAAAKSAEPRTQDLDHGGRKPSPHQIVVVDSQHDSVAASSSKSAAATARPMDHRPAANHDPTSVLTEADFQPLIGHSESPRSTNEPADATRPADSLYRPRVDAAHGPVDPSSQISVETRIDVIRMQETEPVATSDQIAGADPHDGTRSGADSSEGDSPQVDEALSYLLRQLRDSQKKDVA
ncbi:MAG: TIGR03546 family protein [Planctomycetota bacterium]